MLAIPPTHIPVVILVFGIVLALFKCRVLVYKQQVVKFALVCMCLLLSLQTWNLVELYALNQGDWMAGHNITLGPGETFHTNQLSNWYVHTHEIFDAFSEHEFSFYIVDLNRPESTYLGTLLNYTTSRVRLTLPYLYSSPLVVASWVGAFHNPSPNQSIEIQVVPPPWIEDWPAVVIWDVSFWLFMPSALLVSLIVFLWISFRGISRKKESGIEDGQTISLGYLLGSLLIIGYLFVFVPLLYGYTMVAIFYWPLVFSIVLLTPILQSLMKTGNTQNQSDIV